MLSQHQTPNSLKKDEYGIWHMEMEHYLEKNNNIDNDVGRNSAIGLEKDMDRFQQFTSQLEVMVLKYQPSANICFSDLATQHGSISAMYYEIQQRLTLYLLMIYIITSEFLSMKPKVPQKHLQVLKMLLLFHKAKAALIRLSLVFLVPTELWHPSTSSTNIPEKEVLAGFADEVIYSLFAKQSEDWDLLHEDLEQIDDLDIEEIDIN
ncbi:hypothetical protein Tco_0525248 [Tanacetum coccineum]